MNNQNTNRPKWLRNKGYLHVSPKIDVNKKEKEILAKVSNPKYVAQHGFYPLIHTNIKDRRYKKIGYSNGKAIRSHTDQNNKLTAKLRPLHYACAIDSYIFGYYADILKAQYESILKKDKELDNAITAYRQIPTEVDPSKFKSNIHFARDVFLEINNKIQDWGSCTVLKFDISKYFSSIDHALLKQKWIELIGLEVKDQLPKHHYNVYRAATNFKYILRDDFRIKKNRKGRRSGFDEKRLAKIRKAGIECFYETNEDFRKALKTKEIKVYSNPFVRKDDKGIKHRVGIPQGLPISAILANMYLLDYDKSILKYVEKYDGFYRRYSDDIIVIIPTERAEEANKYVSAEIKKCLVEISPEKTERFDYKLSGREITSVKKEIIKEDDEIKKIDLPNAPLNYLGFEYINGNVLIASKNLSKFYRRLILATKRKAKQATKASEKDPFPKPVIYQNQLFRLYTNIDLKRSQLKKKTAFLSKNGYGEYVYRVREINNDFKGNYFTYVKRAAEVMGNPKIKNQTRNHKKILNQALKNAKENLKD